MKGTNHPTRGYNNCKYLRTQYDWSKYIKQLITNIKELIDSHMIIVGVFNTPFTSMDRSSKQKTNKKQWFFNDTLDQMDLTDTFRTVHPKIAEYTFFSSAHRTFSRINHILDHKISLNKFKKIEVLLCIFSEHSNMKLAINNKKKSGKNTNTWRLNEWVNISS